MKRMLFNEEIASVMYELYLLLHAGVSVGDSLTILAEEKEYGVFLEGMSERADNGASLAECLRESGSFPSYVCGLIEVGENSGRTEEALMALSLYYDRRERLNGSIRRALLYPAIMLVLMLVVIGIMLVKVLPVFDEVYASLGTGLTGAAGGLFVIGQWLDKAMPVLWILLMLSVVFFVVFAVSLKARERVLKLFGNAFGDKGISRMMNTSKIVQALAMSLSSGLKLEEALDLAGTLMEDTPAAKKRCHDCRVSLEEGKTLSEAMQESGLLPNRLCRVLELGQRGGNLDTVMERTAEKLSEECEESIDRAVGNIEPALVIVCSILVGLILLSAVLPLMHIMSAIG